MARKTAATTTLEATVATLKKLGTARNVKIYRRHGAGEDVYGVSFSDLGKLAKKIGVNPELSEQLWATGNADARALATMVADPETFTLVLAEKWVKSDSYPLLMLLLGGLVARTKFAKAALAKWTRSKAEAVRTCGYTVLVHLLKDGDEPSDAECRVFLERIAAEIHGSPDQARKAMNGALIAIGGSRPRLRTEAIETARRVGKVVVDHGETDCKVPDAESSIQKMAARASGRAPKKARAR